MLTLNENLELVEKKEVNQTVLPAEVSLGVTNGSVPSEYYSEHPCSVGYTYIRFEVNGNIKPCCIAKYEIGSIHDVDWREAWHSTAMMMFRKKMARIHIEKFHKFETDWLFCQQCSHLPMNARNYQYLTNK